MKIRLILTLHCIIFLFLGVQPAFSQESSSPKILVLHSYHKSLSWVESIEEGIVTVFNDKKPDSSLRFEYMDTKRINRPDYLQSLLELYKIKFKGVHFDAIICSDNNALTFLLSYAHLLFPDTPIVFCGINNFKNEMLAHQVLFTGTIEGVDFKATIDIALKIHPKTERIIFYGDDSPTYHQNTLLLDKLIPVYGNRLQFQYKNNFSIEKIRKDIQHLKSKSLVLLGSTIRKENGDLLSFEESIKMMESVSKTPIYGCWDFYLGHGLVGGMVINGFSQGKSAATLAIRILNGEAVADIPVVMKSPNHYIFDNNQLKKFNIDASILPEDAIILNKQLSLYSLDSTLIKTAFGIISILTIVILTLSFSIRSRRRTEKKLKESKNNLRTVIDAIPDLVWLKDLNGVYLFCNLKFERMFGAKETDITGKTDYDFVDETLANLFTEKDRIIITSEISSTNEEKVTYADDGHIELLETIKIPMHDSDEKLIGVLGIGRDITKYKRVESELKIQAENLNTIFNNAPNILMVINIEGQAEKINYNCAIFSGKKEEDIIGHLGGDILNCLNSFDGEGCGRNPKCSHCPVRTRVESTLQTTKPHREEEAEMTFLINNEEVIRNFLISTVLLTLDGVSKVLLTLIDITNLKETEKALQEQAVLLEKTQEISHLGTWKLDIKRNDLTWTDENYRIFDIPIGTKLTYENFLELVHSDDREYVDKMWKDALQNGLYDIEHRLLVNGKTKWVRQKAEFTCNERNEYIKAIGFTQDITDLKKAMEGKKASDKKRLKLRVQLQQAQKMEAIGTLAGGIAHDFNNILTAILGYSQMARDDLPIESQIRKDLDQVIKASERAVDLVKQILTFSRQGEENYRPVKVQLVIKEVFKLLRASLPTSIQLKENIDKESGLILADSTQVHQVLMNLCTNAKDAIEGGIGTLSVSLTEVLITKLNTIKDCPALKHGTYLDIGISDTGCGMDRVTQSRIFDPFFTTKEKSRGTGLGLAVVHGIVQQHKGEITVASELGQGTTFHIYMPVIENVENAEYVEIEEIPRGSERILFVDDETSLVDLMERMLSQLGYNVTGMSSSTGALALYKKNPDNFDLVITDMTMPEMTGIVLARSLFSLRPDLPVILCTGFSEVVNEPQAKLLGIREYLTKPIDRLLLAKAIRRALSSF